MLSVANLQVNYDATPASLGLTDYYKEPEQTRQVLVEGWLRTGDLGTMDAEGHFYVVDRKKDVITRGGQNVYPAYIEEVLYSDPAGAEAAAIAEPEVELGDPQRQTAA
ncbi:AMP-binding protein [Enterovirga sp. DB1703]|uniref:AMP-binding protein n=2 Tax=Enterovirga aerilata TaxID=2730920 RepID=A0A849IDS8_9HYPH|nr:AMP-binding protein [Enterovirga sp. DB1703]NNM74137.1 AMP-binding protein [Enterovirga sp. DB1703]